MFEKFKFSSGQIQRYFKSALRDFKIASRSKVPEVVFRFCYDAILKGAITVCAKNSLRVKARKGHHYELVNKLSQLLGDRDIGVIGNQMRSKRNWDLYGGGAAVSEKEAKEYLEWTKSILQKVDEHLSGKNQKRLV